jgi:adenylylsulfate reductase subunit B
LGGAVIPLRGTDSIMWTVKFRNGVLKRFKFPIRTTEEASIDCYGGKPEVDMSKIKESGFFNYEARKE